MPYKIPTAHHQQQDDQQRGHEHQQGQPDVVPHLKGWRTAGSEPPGGGRGRAGGRVPGFSCGHQTRRGAGAAWEAGAPRQRPEGGAERGRPHRPSFSPWPAERGRRRAAGRLYTLIAPGPQGRGARRPRRRPDALSWRTPRACG